MDYMEIGRTAIALLFVLSLILLVAWLVRRYGLDKQWGGPAASNRRLKLVERLTLDPRRQLVLVRHQDREHLLLLGASEVSVIESRPADSASQPQDESESKEASAG